MWSLLIQCSVWGWVALFQPDRLFLIEVQWINGKGVVIWIRRPMVKLWKVNGSMSVSKRVHFFVMEKNLFPLSLVCLTYVHFFIKIFLSVSQTWASFGSCRVKVIYLTICFNFSKEEMKAAINECRDDKVNFTISLYYFSRTLGPKGMPGPINTVFTRKSCSCTLRFIRYIWRWCKEQWLCNWLFIDQW